MRKAAFLLSILLTMAPSAVRPALAADAASADTLRLEPLLREALAANPEVAEARALWRAAESHVPNVGALEDPVVGFMIDDEPVSGNESGSREIFVSQKVPFPGKRGPATDEARWQAEAAREMALEAARRVATEVRVAFYDLFKLESQLFTLRESRGALGDAIDVARSRYETGVAGQQDFLLARVEGSERDGEIVQVEAQAAAARARLNLLLARDPSAPLGVAHVDSLSPFETGLDSLRVMAASSRAVLRAAERDTAAADAAYRLTRVSWRPDFMLGGGYMIMPGMIDEWRAEVAMTVPLWKGRKQDAAALEAENRLEASRRKLEGERNRVTTTVEELYAHVSSERVIVRLYGSEILPQAELAYRSARANYLTGQVTFLVLLDSLRKLIGLRKTYYEYLADSEMDLAKLEEAVGRDLGAIRLDALLEEALETEGESSR